ncbi:acyltransferase [Candidatus Gracilibacteria bacterium]|nr:acyltransferase [Candidatus Gracilibacteria bacterium]
MFETQKQGYPIAPVTVGRYVFIGAGAKILPGVNIGDGALVSAGAIVAKSVEPFQIVGGNPASVIGDTRKLDARYLRDEQLRRWYNEWHDNS